jgi:hypothetical protein
LISNLERWGFHEAVILRNLIQRARKPGFGFVDIGEDLHG